MSTITVEELDLLTFFECEPKRLDEDIPWPYNGFTYEYDSGGKSICFAITPAYKDLRLVLKDGSTVVYELNARGIVDVVYERHSNHESLLVIVSEKDRLVVRLKPHISIDHIVGERT